MISKQYKFIYVAIPKCAGTSVRNAVKPYSELSTFKDVYGENGKGFTGKVLRKIFGQQKYYQTLITQPKSHIDLVKKLTKPDYFMFTFVRNPYARTVSLWKYLQPDLSFDRFIDWLEDDSKKSFHDLAHIKSCSFYLNLYKQIFPSNHYVGRVEHLNDDFEYVRNQLKLPSLNIPKLNTTQHIKYQNYYDRESMDRINKIYYQDFKLFDYKFNVADLR